MYEYIYVDEHCQMFKQGAQGGQWATNIIQRNVQNNAHSILHPKSKAISKNSLFQRRIVCL